MLGQNGRCSHPPKVQGDLGKVRGLSAGWKENEIGRRMMAALELLPTRQELEVHEAADRLVAWVRECGRCGTYTDRDFSDLCAEFFEAEEIEPIADNILRPVLVGMTDDVLKSRTDNVHGKGKRKRTRNWRWTILEAEGAAETMTPWDELPMLNRRAA